MPEMTMHDFPDPQHDPSGSHAAQSLGDTLRWAFELDSSPAIAGAAFLTREIIPAAKDPFDAIIAASTTQHQLEDLKNAYKMLRTTGATAPERSLAARLYAATIAAWFGVPPGSLASVFPNLPHFANPTLGFLQG